MTKLNIFRCSETEGNLKSATRPGDYEIGSIQSRAAARALLPAAKDRLRARVLQTLSNAQIDALIVMIEQGLDGMEQRDAMAVYEQRLKELKATGTLTAKPWPG